MNTNMQIISLSEQPHGGSLARQDNKRRNRRAQEAKQHEAGEVEVLESRALGQSGLQFHNGSKIFRLDCLFHNDRVL